MVQEKVPSPLKDIAIYRLQRVDKALERLNAAVDRLDTAIQTKGASETPGTSGADSGNAALKAELSALRKDYDALHAAASSVADRLDSTVAQMTASASKSAG